MARPTYRFTAELWLWEAVQSAWHFVSLPEDVADEIEERYGSTAAGFGSVPVEVRIGKTAWKTSIFPDSKRATYVLPIKKQVRTAEKLAAGGSARVEITIAREDP